MDSTSNDLSFQLEQVKATLSDLTARINNIESVLKLTSPAPEETSALQSIQEASEEEKAAAQAQAQAQDQAQSQDQAQDHAITKTALEEIEPPLDNSAKTLSNSPSLTVTAEKKETANLESTIGSLWLNRLGIGSLVIGVALFVLYSFPSWPPLAKILAGLLTGLSLTFGGEFFAKQLKADDRRYGEGLIGGGWALTYFSTYAGHYIQSVQVVQSPILAALLLLAVCAAAFFHAREKNSQVIAILSVALSFYTICIQPLTVASLGGCL